MTKKISSNKEFTESFKMQAVDLIRTTGRSAASVAKQLNVPVWKLRAWLKAANELSEMSAEQEELVRLRNEIKTLREDNDFLKKAAAYFAKSQQ